VGGKEAIHVVIVDVVLFFLHETKHSMSRFVNFHDRWHDFSLNIHLKCLIIFFRRKKNTKTSMDNK